MFIAMNSNIQTNFPVKSFKLTRETIVKNVHQINPTIKFQHLMHLNFVWFKQRIGILITNVS